MTMEDNRTIRTQTSSDQPMEQQPMGQQPMGQQPMVQQPMVQQPMVQQPMVQQPMVQQPAAEPFHQEAVTVSSHRRVSPAAIVATIAAVMLVLWGAVALARAGVASTLREPVVEVFGFSGTAILAIIVLASGFVLLLAGLSRDRGAILFVSIVIGIAAATMAIEPDLGGDALMGERGFGIAVLIGAAVTALVAALTPDVDRTAQRREIR